MAITVLGLALEEWAHIATSGGVVIAVITYVTSTLANKRQRSIDNAIRYWDCHGKLFAPNGYIRSNVKAMEAGTYNRDLSDIEMEVKFNEFLSNCEHVALLQKAGGVPKTINAYMMGWFAKKIFPELTDREKAEPYWEIAVDFLRETKLEAERLDTFPKEKRIAYLKKNHFR
ncbi:hypothetical protein KP004_00660 [Geomonas oryzisoli]|uniref:DUF4760 domain-containing protein n=1 Tax=Geomonas oryzisoli TaxID=2847992 RepID=A0ABX8JDY3_9BACT|nr:hypothetical protein [Geomonas oryzisoli]QWV93735.1 hypothetical protein KP004_00660 [Geomonas oryzisoli]